MTPRRFPNVDKLPDAWWWLPALENHPRFGVQGRARLPVQLLPPTGILLETTRPCPFGVLSWSVVTFSGGLGIVICDHGVSTFVARLQSGRRVPRHSERYQSQDRYKITTMRVGLQDSFIPEFHWTLSRRFQTVICRNWFHVYWRHLLTTHHSRSA